MSKFTFFVWMVAFLSGVALTYFVPESIIELQWKFIFLASWGTVLGLVLFTICRRRVEEAEANYNIMNGSPKTQYVPVMNPSDPYSPLPPGGMSAAEALAKAEADIQKRMAKKSSSESSSLSSNAFPLNAWNSFCKQILKNRPFSEVVSSLEMVLPELFPKGCGVLYMYGGEQTALHKIVSFGPYVISDDTIYPAECASFNLGEIVVTDYSKSSLSSGCTHLHHHPKGISFCSPIEGLEEHFGILTIQTDEPLSSQDIDFWKAKVSIVTATFGLYVANQNLNIRFQQHSIRDSLTGLFNKRYMEESLKREIAAANRHKTPIGIIMLHPDMVQEIQASRGRHAVEQLLWEVGGRLPNYIRTEDIPCRLDGDTFCIILPGADYKITRDRAEKIRFEISELQIAYGDGILATTLSIGVSVLPVHAADAETLIYAADAAMRMAINKGANRVISADALQQ
ncbi:MAG: GGDEF domain-containing protein [Fibrobacteraceae bacterium]|nr:GGDEF domain-containing protein [Fibrobacteraceae bacterium]